MQDQPIFTMDEPNNLKPAKKKKPLKQMAAAVEDKGDSKEASNLSRRPQKGNKRALQSDVSHPSRQTDRLTSDSFLDPSGLSDAYRQLRHAYLLLEEESFSLDRELDEVDAEVKALEDEKLALLDQLVVLEGLVDSLEIKRVGGL